MKAAAEREQRELAEQGQQAMEELLKANTMSDLYTRKLKRFEELLTSELHSVPSIGGLGWWCITTQELSAEIIGEGGIFCSKTFAGAGEGGQRREVRIAGFILESLTAPLSGDNVVSDDQTDNETKTVKRKQGRPKKVKPELYESELYTCEAPDEDPEIMNALIQECADPHPGLRSLNFFDESEDDNVLDGDPDNRTVAIR
ncbi:hypothetical protein DL771_005836 [Monosporascus sp. 5C6A]|nr:hypothetical protein DL771_005836 [Monosporascus sp. 5C6A]